MTPPYTCVSVYMSEFFNLYTHILAPHGDLVAGGNFEAASLVLMV